MEKKVSRQLNDLRDGEGNFFTTLYDRIRKGDLDDLKLMLLALELKGKGIKTSKHQNYPPLHQALLFKRRDVAEYLIYFGRSLRVTESINPEEGERITPLQMAVYQGDISLIRSIVNVIPSDKRHCAINTCIKINSTKCLLLHTAVISYIQNGKENELKEILYYLVQEGADLRLKTDQNDTLLHLLVLEARVRDGCIDSLRNFLKNQFEDLAGIWFVKSEMKRDVRNVEIRSWVKKKAMMELMNEKNKDGLTPLLLAAKVESLLYLDLVNWDGIMRFPNPRSSQFSSQDFYDVSDISSINDAGRYNKNSVMHIVAHNSLDFVHKYWKKDIVDTEPLASKVKGGWSGCVEFMFFGWFVFHFIYMILLTYFTLNDRKIFDKRPGNALQNENITINSVPGLTYNASEHRSESKLQSNPAFCGFLLVPLLYIIFEFVDCRTAIEVSYSIVGNTVYRFMSVIFSVFMVVWFGLHMVQSLNQDIALAVCLLLGWMFCTFFTRAIKFPGTGSQIGTYAIMVQRILVDDLIPFFCTSFFIMVSFTTAIQTTLWFTNPDQEADLSFGHTLYQMLKYFAGLDDPMGEGNSRDQTFAKFLLSMYGIIITVLLINMLIAAMNRSYDIVRETNYNLVERQRLSVMLLLQRRLCCLRKNFKDKCSYVEEKKKFLFSVEKKTELQTIAKGRAQISQCKICVKDNRINTDTSNRDI